MDAVQIETMMRFMYSHSPDLVLYCTVDWSSSFHSTLPKRNREFAPAPGYLHEQAPAMGAWDTANRGRLRWSY